MMSRSKCLTIYFLAIYFLAIYVLAIYVLAMYFLLMYFLVMPSAMPSATVSPPATMGVAKRLAPG